MVRALQGRRSCSNGQSERLTVAWLFLGSLAVLIYAGDSFLAVQVDQDHGKLLGMLLLYGGVLILLGALMHALAESCRSTAPTTVDRDGSSVDRSWSQGDGLPALRSYSSDWRSSRTRESVPNQASQGIRCMIWASCTYRQLGADVSAFHTVYSSRNYKLAEGSPVSILPAVPVVRSSTCVCCLEDFRPCSAVAVLRCGHTFHRRCIESWVLSGSSSAAACPVCRESLELRTA
ncbi:ATL72 [Symbiodinium sp. CCMP2592]|nr:ATL72 [Symbiodinium sp. CCMP2592]